MGVFLALSESQIDYGSLPHARGGVSFTCGTPQVGIPSSPRTWGCFYPYPGAIFPGTVFPTHVGVFLSVWALPVLLLRLPHARGGVSPGTGPKGRWVLSSPRTWGCFSAHRRKHPHSRVFPTHVGVFLRIRIRVSIRVSLPHARGGVSVRQRVSISGTLSSPRTWGCF